MSETYELVKFVDGSFELEVNVSPEEDTVWLTQEQMAVLFQKAKSTINWHINKAYEEGELSDGTMKKFENIEFSKKPTNFYNLDVVIAVGYRVKSLRDGYVDRRTLYMLSGKRTGVSVLLFSSSRGNRITGKEISDFNAQYPSLEVHVTDEFHDRFLILDRRRMYHIGASVKDAGSRTFEISESSDGMYLEMMLGRLSLPEWDKD